MTLTNQDLAYLAGIRECAMPMAAEAVLIEYKQVCQYDLDDFKKKCIRAVLSQFEPCNPEEAEYCYGGKWYTPIWSCDTLEHIIDSIRDI